MTNYMRVMDDGLADGQVNKTKSEVRTSGPTILTMSIQFNNRSGSFSCKADYTPLDNGNVRIDEWTFDSYGILPNGAEVRVLPLVEAQQEYRERKSQGWH